MRNVAFASWVLIVLSQSGCGAGRGGTVTVPCEAARCNETCVAAGNEAGACTADECVCRPHLDLPAGPTAGLSSGGAVQRRTTGFQMELSIGPVAPAAQPTSPTRDVELGVQPQTDPARLQAP